MDSEEKLKPLTILGVASSENHAILKERDVVPVSVANEHGCKVEGIGFTS